MSNPIEKYLPLTEATSYILMALKQPTHGYAIMQQVEEMSAGTVRIGPGTLYTAFSTLEADGLITKVAEQDRRKYYLITPQGKDILQEHIRRTSILVQKAEEIISKW